ncbi:opsin-5-like [Ruditapes philippinarum]|uniref:opsin-5-like n=1 Tax=Ruditapes philippinarum TaxID=129788 RepID=UPI00295A9D2A|nr:opsin-5-like [Ruditapes philippinarum]
MVADLGAAATVVGLEEAATVVAVLERQARLLSWRGSHGCRSWNRSGLLVNRYKGKCIRSLQDKRLPNCRENETKSYENVENLIGILAFTLNALVIYTCVRHWNSLIMSDYYILNLACSDVLLPISAFPLPIFSSFYHRWMFGEIGCVIYGFLGFFFGVVSITTLTIMGFTRYISICHPSINLSGQKFRRCTIILPYVYALVWSSLPLSGWGSYSLESYGTSCTLQWNENRAFITMMSLFCIFTPSVIIFFAYSLILLKCRNSNRNVREWQRRTRKMSRKEFFLIKITFAMCWGFLLSWMPYAIVSMWSAYGDVNLLPIRFTATAVLMAKSSTVVNPIIYFLMSKKFRPLLLRSLNLSDLRMRASNLSSWKVISELFPIKNSSATGSSNTTSDSSFSGPRFLVRVKQAHIEAGSDVQL